MDCPQCGYAMSDFDRECPRCKGMAAPTQVTATPPQPPPPEVPVFRPPGIKPRKQQLPPWAIATLICCGVGIWWMCCGGFFSSSGEPAPTKAKTTPDPATRREELGEDAYYASLEFVSHRLKAPSTAKYPWQEELRNVTDLGGGRYQVVSYVDSQNSFGAMLRTDWICIVRRSGDDWVCEGVAFE